MTVGLIVPRKFGVESAIKLGNFIPGPGEPDQAHGGHGKTYNGNPIRDWGHGGQYP